jgi:hypothetical protein
MFHQVFADAVMRHLAQHADRRTSFANGCKTIRQRTGAEECDLDPFAREDRVGKVEHSFLLDKSPDVNHSKRRPGSLDARRFGNIDAELGNDGDPDVGHALRESFGGAAVTRQAMVRHQAHKGFHDWKWGRQYPFQVLPRKEAELRPTGTRGLSDLQGDQRERLFFDVYVGWLELVEELRPSRSKEAY